MGGSTGNIYAQLIAAAGGIVGAAIGAGEKPIVPEFESISERKAQQDAGQSNLANFEDIKTLTQKTNRLNAEEAKKMLDFFSPGWEGVSEKQRSLAMEELSGNLPQDVRDMIQRSAASHSMAGGYGGSGMSGNLTLRDLGLNSLQATAQGFNHAQQWLAAAQQRSAAPMFNAASMFITPQMSLDVQKYNSEGRFQRQWMQNLVDAAPDPMMSAIGNAVSQGFGGAAVDNYNFNAIPTMQRPYPQNQNTSAPNQMNPMSYSWQNGGQGSQGGSIPWDSFGSPSSKQSGGLWDNASSTDDLLFALGGG